VERQNAAAGCVGAVGPRPLANLRRSWLEREPVLGWILVTPALAVLVVFIAYPFVYGLWLSLTDSQGGNLGRFVGLRNFIGLWKDSIFRQTVVNSFNYTIVTLIFKIAIGMVMALLLNRSAVIRNLLRAALLLPWIVPTVLGALAWFMLFDSTFSPFSWTLIRLGVVKENIAFLGDPTLAMGCLMLVNVWRGVPFFGITLLAALQAVPTELYEAATVDGASAWQQFRNITVPMLEPVLVVVTLLSLIWTFSDFQLIYVLTQGGPADSTHVFATLAYQVGLGATQLGVGAAISVAMFPVLAIFAALLLWWLRRREI
jgi:multiple sugar transport system permease protein